MELWHVVVCDCLQLHMVCIAYKAWWVRRQMCSEHKGTVLVQQYKAAQNGHIIEAKGQAAVFVSGCIEANLLWTSSAHVSSTKLEQDRLQLQGCNSVVC